MWLLQEPVVELAVELAAVRVVEFAQPVQVAAPVV